MAETSDFEFHIYNSMTKQKEKFKPLVPGKVSMYVCGVTSYDYSHIGHARAYVAFDVLYRLIQFPSKSAYDAALREVTRKGCLYKLERVSVL